MIWFKTAEYSFEGIMPQKKKKKTCSVTGEIYSWRYLPILSCGHVWHSWIGDLGS